MRVTDDERTRFSIANGDLLICEGGEPGRCAVWSDGPNSLAFQKALLRLRPLAGISSEWIANTLRLKATDGDLERSFTGTTIKHLTAVALSRLPVLIPPISEQRRIIAKLDALSARSKTACAELDQILRLVARYKTAVLAAAFEGRLSAQTEQKTLGAVCDIKTGFAFKSSDFQNSRGVPVVRIGDIVGGEVSFTSKSRFLPERFLRHSPEFRVEYGDVLVALSGATTGKSGMYGLKEPALLNQRVARVRAENPSDRAFLAYFIQLKSDEILNASYGGAQPNISPEKLASFELSWPINGRREIVKTLDAAFTCINSLASQASSARKLIDRLDQVLLAKAFRGELVRQDPNDEPASVLLERIRASRAVDARTGARRGRTGRSE